MQGIGHRNHTGRALMVLLLLTIMVLMTGCSSFFGFKGTRKGVSSSVVDYLYPKGETFKPAVEGTPAIKLPARVGLMFVPSSQSPVGVSAADQQKMLEAVREAFSKHEFIDRIEIIPQNYLRAGGGFDNVEQVARMYGVDIVALVAYDQLLRQNDTMASILYWTIVGAYTIPGSKNDVSTFVETAVFDVASRTLLLRAPGQDQRKAVSTALRLDDARYKLAGESFKAAMTQMIENLNQAIVDFDGRVRKEKQVRLVERSSGDDWYVRRRGGGAVSAWDLALLMLGAGAGWLWARRRRA